MIQDTLAAVTVVADTVKVAADTLAATVGSAVGAQVTAWATLGLSIVTTACVSLSKRALAQLDAAPPTVKAVVAVLFAQAATWVGAKTGVAVNTDITALQTTMTGLVVAFGAMGVHALSKITRKSI